MTLFSAILQSGFFQSPQVENALWLATSVGVVCAIVGVFVVIRGQSFAGHILTDAGATGAAASFLVGVNAWFGFLSAGLLAGAGIEGIEGRARKRDIGTGLILTFFTGLGALMLFLSTRLTNAGNASVLVFFGSIFLLKPALTPWVVASSAFALLVLGVIYRPLLLSSLEPELAQARGVPTRLVGFLFMMVLAIAVEDSSLVMGALLSTAFLIGPPATAVRLATRMSTAIGLSVLFAVVAAWLGIALAYASYYWPPAGRGYPVSFLIALIIFVQYLGASALAKWRTRA